RVDERVAVALVGFDHADATRLADLVGGEAHALAGAHGVEEIGDEGAHLVVHRRHFGRGLPQHRRAEQVDVQQAHFAAGSGAASGLTTLVIRSRSTTRRDSPDSMVTRSSFMWITLPTMPPLVITSSPRLRPFSISWCWACCWR